MNTLAICVGVVTAVALFILGLASYKLSGLEITSGTSYLFYVIPGQNPRHDAELALIRKSRGLWTWVLVIAAAVLLLGCTALGILALAQYV
jgi:hypothetical protein